MKKTNEEKNQKFFENFEIKIRINRNKFVLPPVLLRWQGKK
jgi:hypothetical protein